ncbi:MAG: hypothetical protein WAX77_12325 [Methylococcaceae bacterium]
MKKLLLGAAVSCALFGGAAHAAIAVNADGTPTAATLANTTQVFLSGSSALKELVERSLLTGTKDGICKTGTVRKYQDLGTLGSNQNAYLCELNAGSALNPILTALQKHTSWKANLLLYKRNEGGSLQGTVPVANNLRTAFLNVTSNTGTCTPASAGLFAATVNCDYSSTNNTSTSPDFGISDVEPRIFTVASGNAPTGTPNIAASYKIVPGVAAVFGVVATKGLRNALQEAQFGKGNACVGSETQSCMPSLSSTQIADIFAAYPAPIAPLTLPVAGAGKIHDWQQFKVGSSNLYSNATVKPASSKLHICSRTIGSGTKAQFGIRFLDNVCNPAGSKMVSQADYAGSNETAGSAPVLESATRPMVHTMASSGGLEECLDELDLDTNNTSGSFDSTKYAGARWAIGIQSLDKNASRSKSYRFIKVDGVAPTLENVANGSYHDWVESVYLYRVGAVNPLSGDRSTLINEVINSFGKPAVLAAVNTSSATHSFGVSGFLAVPNAVHPASVTGKVDLTAPVNPLSYAIYPATSTNSTNNCRVPLLYSTPSNNTQGLQLVP